MSTQLCELLFSGRPADVEVEAIASDPLLRREAQAAAPQIQRLAQPCGDDAVRCALQPLVLVYGVGEAAKSPAFWRVYVQQLARFPTEALHKAVDDYPATGQFFPKPADLVALAEKHARPIRQAAHRTHLALKRKPAPAHEPADPEQVGRLMTDFRQRMLEKHPPKQPVLGPPTHGKIDGTGITPEMRALLQRQAQR